MGIAQCNNKKIMNVTKIEIDAMLVLLNKTMKSSNVRKKVREPPNVRKKRSYVILKLHNVRIKPSNVKKRKSKGTIKCEKRTVIYNIGTAQCEVGTIKCEKKIREPPNVIKKISHMTKELHNVRIKPSNVRKKK